MFFKNRKEHLEDAGYVDPVTPTVDTNINDVYTIGNNLKGDTIINLKSGYTSMVLTLTPPEVNRMIRLLRASLESYEIEEEEITTQENK